RGSIAKSASNVIPRSSAVLPELLRPTKTVSPSSSRTNFFSKQAKLTNSTPLSFMPFSVALPTLGPQNCTTQTRCDQELTLSVLVSSVPLHEDERMMGFVSLDPARLSEIVSMSPRFPKNWQKGVLIGAKAIRQRCYGRLIW